MPYIVYPELSMELFELIKPIAASRSPGKHDKLMELITTLIRSGKWPAGHKLPALKVSAKLWGMTRPMINQLVDVYVRLTKQGFFTRALDGGECVWVVGMPTDPDKAIKTIIDRSAFKVKLVLGLVPANDSGVSVGIDLTLPIVPDRQDEIRRSGESLNGGPGSYIVVHRIIYDDGRIYLDVLPIGIPDTNQDFVDNDRIVFGCRKRFEAFVARMCAVGWGVLDENFTE